MKKIRVGILFGGKSAEHEVSLQSAKNVLEAIDTTKYEPVLIGIDKQGRWYLSDASRFLLKAEKPSLIKLHESGKEITVAPGGSGQRLVPVSGEAVEGSVDVVFPILHGPFGEDGTIQGMLKLANIPFVGAGVLGSAVGMDKDVMKRLLRDAGIPIPKFLVLTRMSPGMADFTVIERELGFPVFVKPANLGSSVGIHKVKNRNEFVQAATDAFSFDTKILIEEAIKGREIECAVLGNENPRASVPGEVMPHHEFYSYESKYLDENGADIEIPAKLSEDTVKEIQRLSICVFQTLSCEGMARVDFFLKSDGTIVVNELNSIPGFTKISMYPKLWEASGISYSDLIDRLIQLALQRYTQERRLKTSYV